MAVIRSFLLLGLLLLAACSVQPEQPPIVVASKGKPALWQVTTADGNGGRAWLFGSVHLLPQGTDWQGPAIDEAIRVSDGLVIEVTGLDDKQAVGALFAAMGIDHDMPRLADRIGVRQRTELDKALDAASIHPRVLDKMETWAAALTLSSSISNGLGLNSDAGVERVLQLRYAADEKPVQGLETVQQQFGFFDALPEKEQRILLSVVVGGVAESRTRFQKMLDAWMVGNVDALLANADEGLLASPLIRETLLDARNRRWADSIGTMVDGGKKPFIAVGAGHLAGKGGVPELLAAKGYVIKRVQ